MASETKGWVGWFSYLKSHDHHRSSHSEATDRGTREVVSPFGGGVHVYVWGVGGCGHRSSMIFTYINIHFLFVNNTNFPSENLLSPTQSMWFGYVLGEE